MDQNLVELVDQLEALIDLREKSESSYAPGAEARLLDLAINALKMAVVANMKQREIDKPESLERHFDFVSRYFELGAERTHAFRESYAALRGADIQLRNRVRHLMGLRQYQPVTSRTQPARNYGRVASQAARHALEASRGVHTAEPPDARARLSLVKENNVDQAALAGPETRQREKGAEIDLD